MYVHENKAKIPNHQVPPRRSQGQSIKWEPSQKLGVGDGRFRGFGQAPSQPPPIATPQVSEIIQKSRTALQNLPFVGEKWKEMGIVLPSNLRPLSDPEQKEAIPVFGGSLDFTKILISDGLGLGGSYFTVAVPSFILSAPPKTNWYVVMNMGDLLAWEHRRRSEVLIHELTHAWQSQHHSNPTAFMLNSVVCQLKGKSKADAYCYLPDKKFWENAAEQIATQVQHTYSRRGNPSPMIIKIIQSVRPHERSYYNEKSLKVISFYPASTPGVKCSGDNLIRSAPT